MFKIEVRSRVVGLSPEALPSNVVLELLNETLTARELICCTVQEQIRDLITLRQYDIAQAQQMLNRQYLTEAEIHQQAENGAIRYPSERTKQPLTIDSEHECAKAMDAFQRGVYTVFVDGHQIEGLDDEIQLKVDSRVSFLRLTPLIGG